MVDPGWRDGVVGLDRIFIFEHHSLLKTFRIVVYHSNYRPEILNRDFLNSCHGLIIEILNPISGWPYLVVFMSKSYYVIQHNFTSSQLLSDIGSMCFFKLATSQSAWWRCGQLRKMAGVHPLSIFTLLDLIMF